MSFGQFRRFLPQATNVIIMKKLWFETYYGARSQKHCNIAFLVQVDSMHNHIVALYHCNLGFRTIAAYLLLLAHFNS